MISKLRSILQLLKSLYRRLKLGFRNHEVWSGNYTTWEDAAAKSSGYNSEVILEKCKKSLLKVKRGEAVYERDSFLFNEIHYSWGLLAGLQRAALENDGTLCVLDFGGSLGSTYYQNREFLSSIKNIQWCIVEQSHFVACGKEYFEDENLKFYDTIEDCLAKHDPTVLILSGVIHILEKPYDWILKFNSLKIKYIIIDRTPFTDLDHDILTIQNVPAEIYNASYPSWFFSEPKFILAFNNYRLQATFESFCDQRMILNSTVPAKWLGFHLVLK